MSKLKKFLQWHLENPHNLNFKMIVSYEEREETLKEMQGIVNILDTGLTPEQIRQMDILYAEKCREVAELRKAQGWIPVEERLPEDDSTKRYIVTDTDGHVWSSIWYGYAEEENKTPCFYCWDDDMWQCYKPDVIAWRPLPEPYQPEQTAKRPEWQERMLHTFLGGHT